MSLAHLPRSRRPEDYYALLGVAADATFRDIEQAYWQATKDRRELLSQLNVAYEALGDANRRAEYDAQRVVADVELPEPTGSRPLRPNPARNNLGWYLQ